MSEPDRSEAIGRILARIDATEAEGAEGFPHYADTTTGTWTRTPDGDWTGGFWVGMLWLAAAATGDVRYRAAALCWSERLLPRSESDTVFRGFLFWYGAALGAVLLKDRRAAEIALAGAEGFSRSYNDRAGLIPLGTEAEEAERVGLGATNIDGVPGGTPLLAWAPVQGGEGRLRRFALSHAEAHVGLCVRGDGSVCQSATFDTASGEALSRYTHKGVSDESTWLRAQTWAMLGFAQAAALDAERFLPVACKVSDWFLCHLPESRVAYWDFDDPEIPFAPVDTSGTAIAAAALLKLAALGPERAPAYERAGLEIVDALVRGHLTPRGGECPPGILTDGSYNRRIGLATSNELIWGSYFLFEALLVAAGKVETRWI